ncbi:SDR family NAD(P)-dependent oxidoreductase [Stieleria varia]|uniref:SDR family NAD(P)-dependent oxidoreductase n=1 Tax=Stieleria varia TaxID=2528005 RepID=UPI0011B50AA5|nr:SDR family oxidoreductase [Stieleria varia]
MDHHDRFKGLVTKIHRAAKRQKRQAVQSKIAAADRSAMESTGIVQQLGPSGLGTIDAASVVSPRKLIRARRCYVCKAAFTQLHHFYHQLCLDCAEANWRKRHQRADLNGRVAVVTGGRIKIGYHIVLKLLRDGADVIMTTRFPNDAATRFQAEADFHLWHDRLEIHSLDLRNIPTVEAFANHLLSARAAIDILVNNAAQTVKRPMEYYRHLLDTPCNSQAQALIRSSEILTPLLEADPNYHGHMANIERYFPRGWLDADGQQIDNRPMQSWLLKLEDVTTLEMLEVYLVNAAAPFLLTGKLKPLFCKSPHARRFIVNVSAMEGQFSRECKTAFHPHTNMAKAALNMLTRTSAQDYAKDGIYMNSVDTGWITDEKPAPLAQRVRAEHGFYPPLDVIDGASRVYDPIAWGCGHLAEPVFGQFLKDYLPHPW